METEHHEKLEKMLQRKNACVFSTESKCERERERNAKKKNNSEFYRNSKLYRHSYGDDTHRRKNEKITNTPIRAHFFLLFFATAAIGGENERERKKIWFGTSKKRNSIESTNTSSTSFLVAVIQT